MSERISTDDRAYREPYIFRGQKGHEMMFDARGSMWITGFLTCFALTWAFGLVYLPLFGMFAPTVFAVVFAAAFGTLTGVIFGIDVTRRIGRLVTSTRTIGYHWWVTNREIHTPRPEPTVHVTTGRRIEYLADPTVHHTIRASHDWTKHCDHPDCDA